MNDLTVTGHQLGAVKLVAAILNRLGRGHIAVHAVGVAEGQSHIIGRLTFQPYRVGVKQLMGCGNDGQLLTERDYMQLIGNKLTTGGS